MNCVYLYRENVVLMVNLVLKERRDPRVQLDQSVVPETQGSKETKEYRE